MAINQFYKPKKNPKNPEDIKYLNVHILDNLHQYWWYICTFHKVDMIPENTHLIPFDEHSQYPLIHHTPNPIFHWGEASSLTSPLLSQLPILWQALPYSGLTIRATEPSLVKSEEPNHAVVLEGCQVSSWTQTQARLASVSSMIKSCWLQLSASLTCQNKRGKCYKKGL